MLTQPLADQFARQRLRQDLLGKERIMRIHIIVASVTSLVLSLAAIAPVHLHAQTDSARPAVLESAAKPIGKIVAITGSVSIKHAGAVIVQANAPAQAGETKVGDLVYQGDLVQTAAGGKVSINFIDGTSFNLSSNAEMALDEYVYDPKGTSNSTLFNLSKGTFTFVAGSIAKTGDMKVDTPVATLGIRGTTPHIEIADDGSVKFSTLVEEGKSKVAAKHGTSVVRQPDKADDKPNLNICRRC
jgi:hypothetical protein